MIMIFTADMNMGRTFLGRDMHPLPPLTGPSLHAPHNNQSRGLLVSARSPPDRLIGMARGPDALDGPGRVGLRVGARRSG
jgi:hypothetical protein